MGMVVIIVAKEKLAIFAQEVQIVQLILALKYVEMGDNRI